MGTIALIDGTTRTIADVHLATNPFAREFTDPVELPDSLAVLPEMKGSGRARDLQEAAATSRALEATLARFAAATTHTEQQALVDQLLEEWADTSGMAGSLGMIFGDADHMLAI
jgi:hypothetical protein